NARTRRAAMAAAGRSAIRSNRSPGGRSNAHRPRQPPGPAPQKRLLGDLQLQSGMDQVRVVPYRLLVGRVELRPAVCVAHLGLCDVRERVSRLDRVGLHAGRARSTAFAAALFHDSLGLGRLLRCRLVYSRTALTTWHVTPPSRNDTAYARPRRLEPQTWVIVLDSLAFDLVHPVRAVHALAIGAGEAPSIAAVRPVRRVKPMRFAKVFDARRQITPGVQRLPEREVRRRGGFLDRTRSTPADHLVSRERIRALTTVLARSPIPKRGDVPLRLDVKRFDQFDALTLCGRGVRRCDAIEERGPARVCGLGWAHDDSLFGDPDPTGDVDDSEEGIDDVRLVDQGGMVRCRLRDPGPGGLAAARVEGNGHDLEAPRPQLRPQLLPHGQVESTASPRRPRDEQHLHTAQRRQTERSAAEVGQLQLGSDGAPQGATTGFRAARP